MTSLEEIVRNPRFYELRPLSNEGGSGYHKTSFVEKNIWIQAMRDPSNPLHPHSRVHGFAARMEYSEKSTIKIESRA